MGPHLNSLKSEIKRYPNIYKLLALTLLFASFLRYYRINQLLGFWYDQGRDALVIWDFIYHGRLFLIGPQMGFTGIFRGPWYYWLIAPFYFLGNGNPLYPTYFLIFISILALVILFLGVKQVGGRVSGLVAVLIASFSYYLVSYARWLSNPTPMFIISALLIYSIFAYIDKKKWALPAVGFLIGMGLNFGAAAEVFYIGATTVVMFLNKKSFPGIKILLLSLILLAVAFVPQILFELRHPGVFAAALHKFLVIDQSFTLSFWEFILERLIFYYKMIASKFWINEYILFVPFFTIVVFAIIGRWKEFRKNNKFTALIIFVVAPIAGTLFFRGNQGNIYEYYFSGYYLYFIMLIAVVLVRLAKQSLGAFILIIFLVLVIILNADTYKRVNAISLSDPTVIAFVNQQKALEWIYKDAAGSQFNLDVYVPPVIPYAYDYLSLWMGTGRCGENLCGKIDDNVPLLYTLYEVDTDAPYRLDAWLERQSGIGTIVDEERFGGIVAQRRLRK